MSFASLKISRKLMLVFASLILIFVAMTCIVVKSLADMEDATNWNNHTHEVLERAAEQGNAIKSQAAAMSGFLLDSKPVFENLFKEAETKFQSASADIKRLTADNAAQQERLRKIDELVSEWRTTFADPLMALARNPANREAAQVRGGDGSSTDQIEKILQISDELKATEQSLLAVRGAVQASAANFARYAMIGGSAFAVIASIVLGWALSRSVATPVAAMTDAMMRLADGDHSILIPAVGRKDEIGEMAGAVQIFKEAAIEKRHLEGVAVETRRLAEEERARGEAARALSTRQQADVVQALASGLAALSNGELLYRIEERFEPEYLKLRNDFNDAMVKLQETMKVVSTNTSAITSGTTEISTAADDLSRRTEEQAASLEETAAALDLITTTVKKTASGADHARMVVEVAKVDAERSGQVVAQAVEAMHGIEKSASQIGQIIGVIDEIAFQTNLLALNAGVEAARAGEAGRGFAVVASEVRALAQRSAEAAKEIKALIHASDTQVGAGVELVGQTGEALVRIVAQVVEINGIVAEIAISAKEQATSLDQVNVAIAQMDRVTQQNAAMVEESTAASHALAHDSEELAHLIARFQVGNVVERMKRPAAASAKKAAVAPSMIRRASGGGSAMRKPEASEEANWAEF